MSSIIIGGAPRCGKSTISNKLSEETELDITHGDELRHLIPTDSLKGKVQNILSNNIPRDSYIFVLLKMLQKKKPFSQIVNDSGGLKRYIELEVENGNNFVASELYKIATKGNIVVEGTYILPNNLYDFLNTVSNPDFYKSAFLVKTDKDKIGSGLEENIINSGNEWWITKGVDIEKEKKLMIDFIYGYSELIQEQNHNKNFNIVDTSDNFTEKIDETIKLLTP